MSAPGDVAAERGAVIAPILPATRCASSRHPATHGWSLGPATARPPPRRLAVCDADAVLSALRDRRGRPNLRVRVLALVLALLLAGPLTVLLARVAVGLVGTLY